MSKAEQLRPATSDLATTAEPRPSKKTQHADSVSADFAADFDDVFEHTGTAGWSPGRRWTRVVIGICLVGIVAAGIAWGPGLFSPDETGDGAQETYTVAPNTFVVEVVEQGQLESSANVHLRSEVSGVATITSIIPDGTQVAEGDIVIEFDRSEFETQVSEQEVKVRTARSQVAEKTNEVEVAKITLEEYINGTYAKELKEAEVEIRLAEENLRSAESQSEYTKRMYRKGYSNSLEVESKEFAAEKARLELEKATVKRDALQDYTYKKEVKTKEGAIAKAEATLQESNEILALEQARLEQLQDSLNKCTIRAPQAGMAVYATDFFRSMSDGAIGPGSQVWQTQTVIWLPDLTQMQVAVNVHEADIRDIHAGMKATVKVQGELYDGEVVAVANQPDQVNPFLGTSVKKYKTIVKILGEPRDLKPGLTAEVTITTQTVPDVLTLPLVSVFTEDGVQYCFVKKGDHFERRKLVCGDTNDLEILVKQGLSTGDIVLHNSGAQLAKEKQAKPSTAEDVTSE